MCLLACQVKVTIGDKSLLGLNDVAQVLINSLVNSFFKMFFAVDFFLSLPLVPLSRGSLNTTHKCNSKFLWCRIVTVVFFV